MATAVITAAERKNRNRMPFGWKATADDIIAKVERGREALCQIKTQGDPSPSDRTRRSGPEGA